MKKIILISLTLLFFILTSSYMIVDNQNYYINYAKNKLTEYNSPKNQYVIIIDYTKSIFVERLFVVDINNNNIILSSKVSHAFNSGVIYPSKYTSSKGVFLTSTTYFSKKWGYAMNIKGLDKGINDNAYKRRIVFHSNKEMKTLWSYGCFATSENINKEIIDLTKGGTLVCVISD
jgi:hypothetical protein